MTVLSKVAIGTGILTAGVLVALKALLNWAEVASEDGDVFDSLETLRRRYRTKMIKIPQGSVGAVLGRGGANVRAIERETRTFVKMFQYVKGENGKYRLANKSCHQPVEEEWCGRETHTSDATDSMLEFAFVEIRGESDENIRQAIAEIHGLVEQWRIPRTRRPVYVPVQVIGSVIGKGGSVLRELMWDYDVRIRVDRHAGSSSHRRMLITGKEDKIALVEARIGQLISRGYSNRSGCMEEDVEKQLLEMEFLREQLAEEW